MADFVRGSQTTLHFFRMLRQSFRMMARTTMYLFIIVFIAFLYRNADPYPFKPKLLLSYVGAKLDVGTRDTKKIVFKNEAEREIKLSNKEYIRFYETSIIPYIKRVSSDAAKQATKFSIWFLLSFLLLVIIKGKRISRIRFLRGGEIVSSGELKRNIKIYNFKKLSFKNYSIAAIPFPNHSEQQHTIITGGSGTGKTQVMLDLLEQIRARGEKVIVYDRMGNFVRKFYDSNKDFILNPLDQRSVNWSLFKEAKTETDFNIIASSLIPNEKYGDPFWSKAARTVFTQACIKLKSLGKDNIDDLSEVLLKYDVKKLHKFLDGTTAASLIDSSNDKTASSIKAVLGAYVESINLLTKQSGKAEFSVREWLNQEAQDSILFLTSRADQHESIKPIMSLVIELAVTEMLMRDQEQSKKIWFFIDELPSLQQLPTLDTALAQSRQFGGAFVLSVQLMAQLREIYGRDGAESISGLCRNRLFFNSPDQDTANWCSLNLGKKEQQDFKESISYGAHDMRDGVNLHKQKELQNLVIPSEIMNLASLQAYIKLSEGMPVAKIKFDYVNREDMAKKFIDKSIEMMTVPIEEKPEIPEEEDEEEDLKPLTEDRVIIN